MRRRPIKGRTTGGEDLCVEVVEGLGLGLKLMSGVAVVTGDGHVVASPDETELGGVTHVEEELGDGSHVFVE